MAEIVACYSPVHPRACGEQTPPSVLQVSHFDRFIPAPAGNSGSPPPRTLPITVHPRACGEQAALSNLSAVAQTVHPRACGEQSILQFLLLAYLGSSPRLRGTDPPPPTTFRVSRFIPAPAGNSAADSIRDREQSVHPRACGEQLLPPAQVVTTTGSSPRLRGTVCPSRPFARFRRFIPAPAGNRFQCNAIGGPASVHPRACGEQPKTLRAYATACGSSPRLRGTVWPLVILFVICRFIPAPAGNSVKYFRLIALFPVHPRACGEQLASARRR